MRRFPSLPTRTLRALCLVAVLVCATAAHAQEPPPTAAEQQTIQKCRDWTTKTDNMIAASIELHTNGSALATQIKALSSDVPATAVQAFAAFSADLRKLTQLGLPASLADQKDALDKQKGELSKACGADVTAPQELADAQADAKTASANIDKDKAAIDKVTPDLTAALDGIAGAAKNIFDSLDGKLTDLKNLAVPARNNPLPDADQRTLTRNLPALTDVLEQMYDAKPEWIRLSKLEILTSVPARTTALESAQTKNRSVDDELEAISGKLAGWVAGFSASSADPKQKAADVVSKVLLDPGNNSKLAADQQKDANQLLSRINAVLNAWPRLSLALKEQPTIDTDDLNNKIAALSVDARALQALVARIADALAGDMTDFVTEHVRLYYFTDVSRLMYALNSASHQVGGLAEAQAAAAAQRKALATAEFDLSDAAGEVNRIQKSVLDLREQQRQQAAAADAVNLIALRLQNHLSGAQRNQQHKEDALTAAQNAANAAPKDPAKQAAATNAQAQKDLATAATTRANDQYTQAQNNATSANDKLEATKADSNGVPAKLAQALQALEAAQAAVSAARRKMLVAAQAESEAFANARDNSPFWISEAVAADTDPIKHVIIFGFPDSATLVLRGKESDVARAKDMIAQFDLPAPQARLTLWSFEINSTVGQFYSRRTTDNLNKSLEIVDEEIGNTRSLVNATLDLLVASINEEVRLTAASAAAEATAFAPTPPTGKAPAGGNQSDGSESDTNRKENCPGACSAGSAAREEALRRAQSTTATAEGAGCIPVTPGQAEAAKKVLTARGFDKWRRVHFFAPAVLTAFGFSLDNPDSDMLRRWLPDPSATTTLGEGLLMMALSCDKEREAIQARFIRNLDSRLSEVDLRTRRHGNLQQVDIHKDMDVPEEPADLSKAFARTWQVLGLPAPKVSNNQTLGGLSSQQFEIAFALRNRHELEVRNNIVTALERSIAEFTQARQERDENKLASEILKAKGRELWKQNNRNSSLPTDLASLGSAERQFLPPEDAARLEQAEEKKTIADATIHSIAAHDAPLLQCLYDKCQITQFEVNDAEAARSALNRFKQSVPLAAFSHKR